MIASHIKVIVFSALVLILSVGHSFCAELAAAISSQTVAEQSDLNAHQAHEQKAESSQHGAHGREQTAQVAEHAPCGPDQSTCEHCEAAQFFKTGSVSFIAALNAQTSYVSTSLSDIIVSSERVISNAVLAALQRHGPPGDTPVSLKTRLLN